MPEARRHYPASRTGGSVTDQAEQAERRSNEQFLARLKAITEATGAPASVTG